MKNPVIRKTVICIAVILFLLGAIGGSYFYATRWSQKHFTVDYQTAGSFQIPLAFDNVSIMFLSDLEYGSFFDSSRLSILQQQISQLSSDIVIFGGDLFDEGYAVSQQDIDTVTAFLKGLSAPGGKFAILGDFDTADSQRQSLVTAILADADFELLKYGAPLKIHNGTSAYINLIGFSYNPELTDTTAAFSSVLDSSYTIAVIHGAKLADTFPLNRCDLTLSGHSHHLQINFPGLGSYKTSAASGSYKLGMQTTATTTLYLSSGLGETAVDARLFSKPSLLFLRLTATSQ